MENLKKNVSFFRPLHLIFLQEILPIIARKLVIPSQRVHKQSLDFRFY